MNSRFKKIRKHIQIVKASGEKQEFSLNKLKRSFKRCGLSPEECEKIIRQLSPDIMEGMTTRKLYQKAYRLIKKTSPVAAVHYSLKRALFELGPAGYHFEDFMAKYCQDLGYQTQVRVVLKGQAVSHEIDVLAHQGRESTLVECKFHNHQGRKNDIKIVLYVKSRFDDLQGGDHPYHFNDLWIASNTSFTTDSIQYANFHSIKLLGTNCPEEDNLIEQIKRHRLYPITSLKKLKRSHIEALMEKNIYLVKELVKEVNVMKRIGMSDHDIARLFPDMLLLLGKLP
jgi:hypothetical protein